MARSKGLAGLTGTINLNADSQTPVLPKSQTSKQSKSQTPNSTESGSSELPRYMQLIRKEARLTEEQSDRLAQLTRQLNRTRNGAGERITDNTLIRVAVDLLLDRAADLRGATEDELRNSLNN